MKLTLQTPYGPASYETDGSGALIHFSIGTGGGEPDNGRSEVARQVGEYFAGKRRRFDLRLAPAGSDFQKKVWAELIRIPFGETITYSELAQRVGAPGAARAVGRANATNPIWLIVPCHRVIGADGSLTGYAGGTDLKKSLLAWEREVADREFALM
jgi:methylated-DNA-[protein]-cysteine S-methyltransferase